mmetsp:Transcript_7873/g.19540  ORF Transcript_7873/g.19540 Transcript_7873/m.19540 type:complete len:445 (-) Transcript_7873:1575-2909(-)
MTTPGTAETPTDEAKTTIRRRWWTFSACWRRPTHRRRGDAPPPAQDPGFLSGRGAPGNPRERRHPTRGDRGGRSRNARVGSHRDGRRRRLSRHEGIGSRRGARTSSKRSRGILLEEPKRSRRSAAATRRRRRRRGHRHRNPNPRAPRVRRRRLHGRQLVLRFVASRQRGPSAVLRREASPEAPGAALVVHDRPAIHHHHHHRGSSVAPPARSVALRRLRGEQRGRRRGGGGGTTRREPAVVRGAVRFEARVSGDRERDDGVLDARFDALLRRRRDPGDDHEGSGHGRLPASGRRVPELGSGTRAEGRLLRRRRALPGRRRGGGTDDDDALDRVPASAALGIGVPRRSASGGTGGRRGNLRDDLRLEGSGILARPHPPAVIVVAAPAKLRGRRRRGLVLRGRLLLPPQPRFRGGGAVRTRPRAPHPRSEEESRRMKGPIQRAVIR